MNHIELFGICIYKSICLVCLFVCLVFFFLPAKILLSSRAVSHLESWIMKMEELLSSCEKCLHVEREDIKV